MVAHWFGHALPEVCALTVGIACVAALVGWLLHAAIIISGGWEPPRRSDPQADDYEDKPPPPVG
jgi:hypothetical protein